MSKDNKELIAAGSLVGETADVFAGETTVTFESYDPGSPYTLAMQVLHATQARHATGRTDRTPLEDAILSLKFSERAFGQQRQQRQPVWLPMSQQAVGVRQDPDELRRLQARDASF